MESAGLMGKLQVICEWVTRLAYVNLLWILFTLIGLIGAGFAPATVAMFSVVRQWVRGHETVPVFATFWDVYKKEFFKANLLSGGMGILISVILIVGFMMGSLSPVFSGLMIGLLFLVAVVFLYLIPVYVHFEYSFKDMIKTSFILSTVFPFRTIAMIGSTILAVVIAITFPAVGVLFFGSASSFVLMKITNGIFTNISSKEKAGLPVISTIQ
ncbi:YesL family protein [Domibacillus robiginosus]|uniref:YesL family protein n=1 Tax=Domibacillus robiginosus TaxID=1071054 RepID=UPI00067DCB8C|nr:DUF624 domain-containing protein [Domibacillus robiginosus]